jgi:signal transduction histidine kinase
MNKTFKEIKYVQPIIIGILVLTGVIVTNYQFNNYQIQLINQNKGNVKKGIEDTISTKNDQINQIAVSLNQFNSDRQNGENIDFNHFTKISLEQAPEIKNVLILQGNKIIQAYPHMEFVGSDLSKIFPTLPTQIDGITVLNIEYPLMTQSTEKIIISVPVDFFVNPVIFSDNFKMVLFNPMNPNQQIYEIAVKDGQVETQGIVFSDDELRNSLTIEKKTSLFDHYTQKYIVLRYTIWDTVFVKQTSIYEQIFLGSGIIISVVIPIVLVRYQRLNSLINNQSTELQRANALLRQVDRSKDEFSAMLSHELKTPLVPIQGYVDILLSEHLGKLNEEQKKRLKVIKENSSSLLKLISDILDIHKLELGQLKITKNENNVKSTVEKSITIMSPFISDNQIELKNHVTKDIPASYDEERIKQVITNLIKNCTKACQRGIGKIEVFAEDSVSDIKLSISDNGRGIPNEVKDNLFKKFYQVDTSSTRESGGSGLGLAISKGIVETHGGKMWFESKEGKGTTFYFTIPKDITKN